MTQLLLDALAQEEDALVDRIRAQIAHELSSYRALPEAELEAHVRVSLQRTLASARTGRDAVGDADLGELAGIGEDQARYGIPVDDMLRVWRIGIELAVDRAREHAAASGISDGDVLEFVQALLAWSDAGMAAAARAHRQAEIDIARQDHERRAAFVVGIVNGTLPPTDVRTGAEAYGIDPAVDYVAVRARPASRELERALGLLDAGAPRRGLGALHEGDLVGFVRAIPDPDVDGVAGVGPARPVDRLAESFRLATRALTTAAAFGLTGVHDLAVLGLRPALAADADVALALRERYLTPLAGTTAGAEIIGTLRVYLARGMHVESAAEELMVHPNTLRYRIGRFEELTGTSLRDTETVVEVWWALQAETVHLHRVRP